MSRVPTSGKRAAPASGPRRLRPIHPPATLASWPEYDRDVLLFNYWANETSPETKNTPNIGSAVAYFNATMRAKAVPRPEPLPLPYPKP